MSVAALSCAMALRDVSPSEKLLLLALANYADEHMQCFPSQRRLADDTCLSDRTVRTLLAGLEARHIISRQERQRRDNSRATDLITLHFAGVVAEAASGGAEIISGGVGKPLPGGAEAASGLTTFEPSPNLSDAIDWPARLAEAMDAAGEGLDLTSTGTMHARDLRALCEPTSGEPCEWGEVLDAIRVCAARAKTRGKPLRSWSWVREDALAFRDKRLNALNPEPQARHVHRSYDDKLSRKEANLARSLAGFDAVAGRRRIEP
jgi:hypothetical protein